MRLLTSSYSAERRFSPNAMADQYEAVYGQLLTAEPAEVDMLALSAGAPIARKPMDRIAASQ